MSNEVAKPNESAQDALVVIIETAPEALLLNENVVNTAITKIRAIIETIKVEGMSAEYDAILNRCQLRLKEIGEEIKDRRMPLTRRLDTVKKAFTEIEALVDPTNPKSIYAESAQIRNEWHTKLAEEKKRTDEAAAKKLKKDDERIRLRSEATQQIRNGFISDLAAAKSMLTSYFNEITLEKFHEHQHRIHQWHTEYTEIEFASIKTVLRAIYHTPEEIAEIELESRQGKFELFNKEYAAELTTMLHGYMDQLPGKKLHLEAEADAKRKAEEAAEEARKKAAAAQLEQDEAKRKQMEADAEEAKRKADEQEAENLRLQKIAEDKAEAERIKQANDELAKKEANKQATEAKAMMERNQTLFDHEAAKLEEVPQAKVKASYEITVKAPSGMLQIVSYYFQHKGNTESVGDLKKRSLDQMITFCEKNALKTGIKIDNPLIEYKEVYKAATNK